MKIIELEQLDFTYPTTGFSLGKITISLNTSQILAVTGENGSGKTTLLRLFAGILVAQSGELKTTEGCRISLVPAELHHYLLPWYSVAKNLAFFHSGGKSTSLEKFESIRNDLADYFESLPFSLMALESRKVWELSTGQLSIIGLACALLTRPSIILLDETFSGLSYNIIQNTATILQRLARKDLCIVFTSHNPRVIKFLATHVYDLTTRTKRLVTEYEEVV